jgi:hypothetical protein
VPTDRVFAILKLRSEQHRRSTPATVVPSSHALMALLQLVPADDVATTARDIACTPLFRRHRPHNAGTISFNVPRANAAFGSASLNSAPSGTSHQRFIVAARRRSPPSNIRRARSNFCGLERQTQIVFVPVDGLLLRDRRPL